MLTELLLLGGASLLGKAALDNPEKAKEVVTDLANRAQEQAKRQQAENERKAAAQLQEDINTARSLYRQGCSCSNCNWCNDNHYCDNCLSDFYDERTYNVDKKYGVGVCPEWEKKIYF